MLGSINTKKWGAQLGQLSNGLKKATSQIVSESNKFVEGFKSTSETKETDSVNLSSTPPPLNQSEEVKTSIPPPLNKPEEVKTSQTSGEIDVKKGVTMGAAATLGMMTLGPMGAALGIYVGNEINKHGGVKEALLANQDKLKGVSEKLKSFAGNVQTNTSTVTVDNGITQTKVATNNGTNSSVPQSLTIIE